MKRVLCIVGLLLCLVPSLPAAAGEGGGPVQVMVLGTYHMDNPGRDVHNLEADDVLTPKRQKELAQLADHLAKFRPTKIAVEVPASTANDKGAEDRKHSRFVDRYPEYLAGEMEPNRNEVVQIGFRLAKKMGHEKVYGIDAKGPFPFGRVAKWAEENGQSDLLAAGHKEAQSMLAEMGEWLSSKDLVQCFAHFNRPEVIQRTQEGYIGYLLPVGAGDEYPGADLVEGWYGRNLRIFANLVRIAEPGDRILVLFGLGHAPYLRQLTVEAPGFELVEPRDYLVPAAG